MARIKSLMYREWVLTKKTLLLGLAAAILMLMLGVFIGNGFRSGSFDGNEKIHTMLAQTGDLAFAYIFAFFLIVIGSNCSALYESDIKANWTRFSMTLPTDTKCRAFAHTLFLLTRNIVAFVISLAAGAVIPAAFGKPFSAVLAVDIGLFCCISMLFVCFAEFFWSKAKDMISYKKQSNRLSAALAVAGVVIGLLSQDRLEAVKAPTSLLIFSRSPRNILRSEMPCSRLLFPFSSD